MNFLISIVLAITINSLSYVLILYYLIFVFRHHCQFALYNMVFIPSTWFLLFASTYTANKLANFIYFTIFRAKPGNLEAVNHNITGSLVIFRLTCLAFAFFLVWDYPTLGPPELCGKH